MTAEVHRSLETYQEGTVYFPQWREVFPAEFHRIFSQFKIEVDKGAYKGLLKLGFKVEKDEASDQLLRIVPAIGDYPQLVFRVYEGRGIKFLSGNMNREPRDWVKSINVSLEQSELEVVSGLEQSEEGEISLKMQRHYEIRTLDGFYLSVQHGPGLRLDASVR